MDFLSLLEFFTRGVKNVSRVLIDDFLKLNFEAALLLKVLISTLNHLIPH